jgi:hypothetical protein
MGATMKKLMMIAALMSAMGAVARRSRLATPHLDECARRSG